MAILKACVISKNQELLKKVTQIIAGTNSDSIVFSDGHDALDSIVQNKHQICFYTDAISEFTPQEFIIVASQKKVFLTTTFVLLYKNNLSYEDKITFMTLGYSAFISEHLNSEDIATINKVIQEEQSLMIAA